MAIYDGFVYIWRDNKHKMFYIGSHQGSIDDGYTGSNKRFIHSIRKRPENFKRKILEYVIGDIKYIQSREQLWLNLILDCELGIKYFNLKKLARGGSVKGRKQPCLPSTRLKISRALTGRPSKNKGIPLKQSTKDKLSLRFKGIPNGQKGKILPKQQKIKISNSLRKIWYAENLQTNEIYSCETVDILAAKLKSTRYTIYSKKLSGYNIWCS